MAEEVTQRINTWKALNDPRKVLDLSMLGLTILCRNGELPENLKWLNCSNNDLTSLPKLPKTLTRLDCYNNKLVELPVLPQTLTNLYCEYNELVTLPDLPQTLTHLNCSDNQLTVLCRNGDLPQTLKWLHCKDNPFITLPEIPKTILTDIRDYIKTFKERNVTKPIDAAIYNAKIQEALNELCPILYEPLQEGEIVLTTCLHVFSKSGFSTWRRKSLECPVCRQTTAIACCGQE